MQRFPLQMRFRRSQCLACYCQKYYISSLLDNCRSCITIFPVTRARWATRIGCSSFDQAHGFCKRTWCHLGRQSHSRLSSRLDIRSPLLFNRKLFQDLTQVRREFCTVTTCRSPSIYSIRQKSKYSLEKQGLKLNDYATQPSEVPDIRARGS